MIWPVLSQVSIFAITLSFPSFDCTCGQWECMQRSTSWFQESGQEVLILSSVNLAIILKTSGIFTHSNAFIICLFLLDFGVSVIMLSYFLSTFFSQANTASLCLSLVYMISFLPYIVTLGLYNQLSFIIQTLLVSGLFCKKWKIKLYCHTPNKMKAPPSTCHVLVYMGCLIPILFILSTDAKFAVVPIEITVFTDAVGAP
jgi:hypothetical protein